MKLPKTLKELKAENARKEQEDQTGQSETPDQDELQDEEQHQEEQTGQSDESEGDGSETKEVPEWMQAETDDESGSDRLMPVKAHVKKRKALQTQLEKKDATIEGLQEQINRLSGGAGQNSDTPSLKPVAPTQRPKLIDFDDEENPEAAFEAAMVEYSAALVDSRYDKRLNQAAATQRETQLQEDLDKHYLRAAELIDDDELTTDEYQAADYALREAADNLQPGSGDKIVNTLLASVGAGSEKVVISLYRKPTQMNQFITALKSDPTGVKVSMLLGKMAARFEGDQKRSKVSSAPAPGKKFAKGNSSGDAAGGGSVAEKRFKKSYDAAHATKNRNKAFSIRRQAEKAGVDVSKW